MSQKQPQWSKTEEEAIKYGDVFSVSGDLASKHIAPQDAVTMQAAENMTLGKNPNGSPAVVMQAAADERCSAIGHDEVTDVASDQGVAVSEMIIADGHVIRESVGDQIMGKYTAPATGQGRAQEPAISDAFTIGDALEATALSAGDKPVDQSDAAAIQAAEMIASGTNEIAPGGVGATAQSEVTRNVRAMRDEDKTKLGVVLEDASAKLPSDSGNWGRCRRGYQCRDEEQFENGDTSRWCGRFNGYSGRA
ncbi:Late embryogenesis abundant protein like [Actinidia chinensis var. chinensis]|uniref:Late embryogenesis abundant protein like n=1 Tax=Actinidia chinensis var. chinensis TaxID=1590841 RepID=A0A2R6QU13_ACTCC|nr:Late embryogenesis abundant protein like [Actinidia chinensis var. chinensis]